MNHFFLEVRSKEKIKELRSEGMTSQALNRNKPKIPSISNMLRFGLQKILGLIFRNSQVEKRTKTQTRAHI